MTVEQKRVKSERARPLSVEDRRAAIIEAVIPLLIERGNSVTTRQIADAAGIAEGTIFRAFADKDALINAALVTYFDPTEVNNRLRAIDPELPLERKIEQLIFHLRARMTGMFGMMNAAGMSGRPPRRPDAASYTQLISDVLRPDFAQLNVSPERVGQLLRLVAFAAAVPQFNEGQVVPIDDLARFITYGIAGVPAEKGH